MESRTPDSTDLQNDSKESDPDSKDSSKQYGLTDMLNEIVINDQKQQEGFVAVAPIAFWTQMFVKYFLHINNPSHDDLLFYVRRNDGVEDMKNAVEVFRRESSNAPGLGDPSYDWTETVYLNMILQQLEYTLTCAICSKNSSKEDVNVHRKVSQQVYASPSRHNMASKGKGAEMCYPNLFFTVDDFDQVWDDLYLSEDEMVCVEIVAHDKTKSFQCLMFLGSVSYPAMTKVYDKKAQQASVTNKLTQLVSFGLMGRDEDRVEFVRMRGPGGKGYAEMAVKKINGQNKGPQPEPSSSSSSNRNYSVQSSTNPLSLWRNGMTSSSSDESLSPSLKTQLTYVTLPWHKIVLDILLQYEKPGEAKQPVLFKSR